MIAQKWNFKTHAYRDYELPQNCRLYSNDLTEKVACCQCGKGKEFGDMYTSKQIHNQIGLGYPVCEECYKLELKENEQNI